MADSATGASIEFMLAEQLHGLINLTTTLTQRLLQLEQRLQQLEQQPVQEALSDERQLSEELLLQGDAQILELQQQLALIQAEATQPQLTVIEGKREPAEANPEATLGQAFDDGEFLDEQSADLAAEELISDDDSESSYSA
ncbi:MAG: hypothetical protein VKJ87_04105 [Synechococcus sp.]|nr:hypothetical protein [Synechococcus sp.]